MVTIGVGVEQEITGNRKDNAKAAEKGRNNFTAENAKNAEGGHRPRRQS